MAKRQPTRLTLKTIDALPWAERDATGRVQSYTVRDTDVKGLLVVVNAQTKVFKVQRDLYSADKGPDGKRRKLGTRRVALGDVRDFGTVDEAREAARKVIADMRNGIDPNRPPEEPKRHDYTLQMAFDGFVDSRERKDRRPSTIKGYHNLFRRYLTDWAARPLKEIGDDTLGVDDLHRRITKKNGPVAANQTMRLLRAVYNYARRKQRDLPPNPVEAVDFNHERKRTEVITDWPAWHEQVTGLRNPITRDWYLFLAFTGMRKGAASEARVEHFDAKAGFLHVPDPKGGPKRAFDLPLSGYLVKLLEARIAENRQIFGPNCPWVFPSHFSDTGHVTECALRELPTPHVHRHSFATAAQAAGLPDFDIKLLLNHKLSDVTGGYIHGTALGDHLRECQERITAYLLGRIHEGENVVPLRRVSA